MSKGFVKTKQLNSPDELEELLNKISNDNPNSYYFLCLPHKVSGIVKKLPSEFPGIQGQIFNENLELRWKKNQKGYQVLLLSNSDSMVDFKPVGKTWETKTISAVTYWKKNLDQNKDIETRFPRKFKVERDNNNIDIAQRYFIDPQTATVHFIALTIESK